MIAAPPGGNVRDYALAVGKVRYVGEPVVAVVADTRERARDAAELVEVEYEPLDVVVDARKALEDGAIEPVIKLLTDAVREGVRRHFHAAYHHRMFDANDVRAGREYVEAYVIYVHYLEGIHMAAMSGGGHGREESTCAPKHHEE